MVMVIKINYYFQKREKSRNIYNKRFDKIEEFNNEIDYNNLKYVVVDSGDEYRFDKLDDPLFFLNDIKKGKISLKEAKNQQQNYYNYLNTIRRGHKNANQKKVLANINTHFNARNNAIKLLKIMVQ